MTAVAEAQPKSSRRRLLPPLCDALFLAAASVFTLGGYAIGPLLLFFVGLSYGRAFARRRWIRAVANVLFWTLAAFTVNGISVLWLYALYAGWVYIGAYVAVVAGSGWLMHRFRPWGLAWSHGVLLSLIAGLGVPTVMLELQLSSGDCYQLAQQRGVRMLVDYGQLVGDQQIEQLTPRFFALDPSETVLYVANRTNDPDSELAVLAIDRRTRRWHGFNPGGGSPAALQWDPETQSAVVATYDEPSPFAFGSSPLASIVWIDAGRGVIDTVPLGIQGDLYSALSVEPERIRVFVGQDLYAYDRASRAIEHRSMPHFSGFSALTNFRRIEGVDYFCHGGSVGELLLWPGIFTVASETYERVRTGTYLSGTYLLGYDPARGEIYTNSQWSGTLHVLDRELRPVRDVEVTDVARAMALDPAHRRGYTADYVGGELIAFDLDTGARAGSVPIGKRVRALGTVSDGTVLVGSECGVFEVSPGVFEPE